jgi:hypothetical protein
MYSPRIYESQIPSLYHASQSLGVPMTQLVNAFVYHGLAGGYYGQDATKHLPAPNQVLPSKAYPKLPIFEATEYSAGDHKGRGSQLFAKRSQSPTKFFFIRD